MIDASHPFRIGVGPAALAKREVDALLASGLLVPVLLDVVVAADTPSDRHLRARALRLLVPDRLHDRGAAVAQEAAAWLWSGGSPPRLVDVAVRPGLARRPEPHLVVHERLMTRDDVTGVGPDGAALLAVTTAARTAADLLRTLPPPHALEAASRLAARTGVSPEEVAACLERMPRARGVRRARRMLPDWPAPVGPAPVGWASVDQPEVISRSASP